MTTTTYHDAGDGNLVIANGETGIQAHVDHLKALSNEGHAQHKGFTLVGSIPASIVNAYCSTNKITFQEFRHNPDHKKRILNDPNLADFRVWKGTV